MLLPQTALVTKGGLRQAQDRYKPKDESENRIKEKILIGLNIENSMTAEQLLDTDFEHKDLPLFYDKINPIGDDFILSYYQSKLNEN